MALEFHETNTANHVMGDTAEELLDYAMHRIRPESREFYRHSIKADLICGGTAIVDRHAIGTFTRFYLSEGRAERLPERYCGDFC